MQIYQIMATRDTAEITIYKSLQQAVITKNRLQICITEIIYKNSCFKIDQGQPQNSHVMMLAIQI